METKLSDVLAINDENEIKPMRSWRELFDNVFGTDLRLQMSYSEYESLCRRKGRAPKLYEWEVLHFVNEQDWPTGA